ncbi:desulfoferrodoxin [Candidatus Solincola tengchongensis]|uniref:desulfoferrodoxin n=1 Tax=Candidatus Solincola tengchongensis TaxID=2900693 RepID=UPI00257AA722|nr:desulfoferrodoxin [Candidatus Solincola tengchongensis]
MTERLQVYKCDICGNIVEVLHSGQGELVCCGQPMVLQVENTVDAAVEKHVPVVEVLEDGILVKVGEVAHPMIDEHYIEWVQIMAGDMSYRIFLKPGIAPEGKFTVPGEGITAREYCNLHGLWKSA